MSSSTFATSAYAFLIGMQIIGISAIFLASNLLIHKLKNHDIKWATLFKVALTYCFYQLASIIISMIRQINNSTFSIFSLVNLEHFFFASTSIYFNIIFLLSIILILFKLIPFKKLINNLVVRIQLPANLYTLFSMALITTNYYYEFLIKHLLVIPNTETINLLFLFPLFIKLGFIFLITLVISHILGRGFADLFQQKPSIFVAIILSIVLSFSFSFYMQYIIRGDNTPLLLSGFALDLTIIFLISILAFAVFNRLIIAMGLLLISYTAFSIIGKTKYEIRSEPIISSDFIWLKQLKELSSFVNTGFIIYLVIVLLFFLLHDTNLKQK